MYSRAKVVFGVVAAVICLTRIDADACHIDPCQSSWTLHAAVLPAPLLACPQGDTPSFLDQGWWISITVVDCSSTPIPSIPPGDFWLIDQNQNAIALCGGVAAVNADSLTNALGQTTMSLTTFVGGGCVDGLAVVAQGFVLTELDCTTLKLEPIRFRSPDLDASLAVDLVDLSMFAAHFPPQLYDACSDFDINGVINLQDLAVFALHFGPPGHSCS